MDSFEVVGTEGLRGASRALVLCEHASHEFPPYFGTLGLDAAAQVSHIAWDPGALQLARSLAAHLEAPLVAARVSRLLYDCNRPPEADSAIPARSETWDIPGNRGLSPEARDERVQRIYQPFCAEVERVSAAARPLALITMHSFTPVYFGQRRDVEIGILHDEDSRLADAILAQTAAGAPYEVRRNAPYGPEDGVTHSLKIHGMDKGIANVMIEVRNDLLATPEGIARVSAWLDPLVARALDAILPVLPDPVAADKEAR